MSRIALPLMLAAALSACTHAVVSAIPMKVDGVDTYRYTGRANFAHQFAEAEKQMVQHCASVNGGRPVIVAQGERVIGAMATSSTSTTATGTANTQGTAQRGGWTSQTSAQLQARSQGSAGVLENRQQDVLFQCVK